jgi:hypothetical protein
MTKKKAAQAKTKPAPKAKITDAERHQRFVDMAHEVEASDDSNVFDEAFKQVVSRDRPSER